MIKYLILFFCLLSHNVYAKKAKRTITEHKEGPKEEQIENGKKIFRKKACGGCHKIGGEIEGGVGPNLKDVTTRRDHKWLVEWIKDPRVKLDQKDPIAMELLKKYPTKMPYLKLTDAEIEDVIEYIKSESNKKKEK